ncbi:Arc family DNA-binding protein [Shinella zoogloeoides]
MSESDEVRITLRLPGWVRDRLKAATEQSGRSMNAEIVARLEESFQDPLVFPPHAIEPIERKAKELRVPARTLILEALAAAFPAGYDLYDFIAKWGHLAAATPSSKERERIIEAANNDERAILGGVELRQKVTNTGETHIQVYSGGPRDWKLAASLLVLNSEE